MNAANVASGIRIIDGRSLYMRNAMFNAGLAEQVRRVVGASNGTAAVIVHPRYCQRNSIGYSIYFNRLKNFLKTTNYVVFLLAGGTLRSNVKEWVSRLGVYAPMVIVNTPVDAPIPVLTQSAEIIRLYQRLNMSHLDYDSNVILAELRPKASYKRDAEIDFARRLIEFRPWEEFTNTLRSLGVVRVRLGGEYANRHVGCVLGTYRGLYPHIPVDIIPELTYPGIDSIHLPNSF